MRRMYDHTFLPCDRRSSKFVYKNETNMTSLFRALCLPKNIIPARYAIQVNNYAAPGMKTLGKGITAKKGVVSQRMVYPVEKDTKRLVTYVCGSNYFKEGEDIKLKPDSEYPDWLWTLPLTPARLEDLDPDTKQYWRKLRKLGIKRNNLIIRNKK